MIASPTLDSDVLEDTQSTMALQKRVEEHQQKASEQEPIEANGGHVMVHAEKTEIKLLREALQRSGPDEKQHRVFVRVRTEMEKKDDRGDEEAARLINDPANSFLVDLKEDEEKWTLLHHAAENGRLALVDPLVINGAVVDAKDEFGQTPLLVCCYEGHLAVALRLVFHGADPTAQDNGGRHALHWAREGHPGLGEEGACEIEAARQEYLDSQIMLK